MLISIEDVPLYERHLLFCSELDHAKRRRPHRRRDPHAPESNRSLSVCCGQRADEDHVVAASGCNSELVSGVPQALRWAVAALDLYARGSASLAGPCFWR
jgi:hypothetical protein